MNYLVEILIIVLVGLGVAVGFVISLFEKVRITTILDINFKLFGYGLGIKIEKSRKNYNPSKPNCKNDGTIKCFKFYKEVYKYVDWSFVCHVFYNYTFILRIFLNRG